MSSSGAPSSGSALPGTMVITKPIVDLSIDEIKSYMIHIQQVYDQALLKANNVTGPQKEDIINMVKSSEQSVKDEITQLKKLLDAKIAANYYFTQGAGNNGGAVAMVMAIMKSMDLYKGGKSRGKSRNKSRGKSRNKSRNKSRGKSRK